mmetsp:Transcript_294/g.548  ORF Transcript_294/g.548 Transcript_294/m.548 type:complete len:362 (-) Transcript_294:699-1784(-)
MFPLPNLSATDLRSCRIFHVMIEGDASNTTKPRFGVCENNEYSLLKSIARDCSTLWNFPQLQQVSLRDILSGQTRCLVNLVGGWHVFIKHGLGERNQRRVSYPGTIMACHNLSDFILLNPGHGSIIRRSVTLNGDLSGHTTHCKCSSLMTNVNQPIHICLQQRSVRHGQMGTIGCNLIRMTFELFDVREQVVPPSAIQSQGMISQFVQNLLHLKRRRDGLQENSRANGPLRHAEITLRRPKDVVPQPRLEVIFQFGQVEVRASPLGQEAMHVMIEIQPEIEQTSRCHASIDGDMSFVQMPSARTDEQDGGFVFEGVNASGGGVGVGDFSASGISEVALSFGEVGPGGGGAVFEIGHVDVGS